MPTGPKHYKFIDDDAAPGDSSGWAKGCRCMVGEDHAAGAEVSNDSLSVWDAADIWLSNGMDEDYAFGFTEEELRRASGN